jgi:glycerol-3-phosphate acyltransferase PlsY
VLSGLAGRDVAVILAAYAIGCIATGYYLVRWRTGQDVRAQGTGSAGATNAARALGKGAFAVVFALDVAKGALAVALARWLGDADATPALAAVAVVIGHIWPVQLGLRGGKGVATAFGATLVLAPFVALGALVVAGVALAAGCRFVLAGLVGIALAPVLALLLAVPTAAAWGIAAIAALVIFGHRQNIAGMVGREEPWLRRDRERARSKERRSTGTAADGRPS